MTKVTYLSHSGFAVTLDEAILVFDYYRDPAHALHRILDDNPDKPVAFFVSHRHKDHFKADIFEIAQNHKRVYIISNDIPAQNIPSGLAVQGMSHGDYVEDVLGSLSIKAFDSTDQGVSFLVTDKEGNRIFHAGDLNDWHWGERHASKEAEETHAKFEKTVNRIASYCPEVDIAFFPVDVRLGADYAAGARYFMSKVKVNDFFPMHFNGDYREACDFASYAPDDVSCHCLREPGQSIELTTAEAH